MEGSIPAEKLHDPTSQVHELYPTAARRVLATGAWALFDLAMTIFSLNIISRYFSQWVSQDNKQPDIVYSLSFSVSLAIVAISSPALGALSDRAGSRLPYLFVMTVVVIVATATIGFTDNLTLGLILFVIANYAYQSTQVFYNSLLSTISTPASRGRIGGVGQALGYSGALMAAIITPLLLEKVRDANGNVVLDADGTAQVHHISAFVPTAIFVTILAIPIFLFMREPKVNGVRRTGNFWQEARQATTQVITSFRNASQYPNLFRFLLARLFYADAANTVVAFMSIYAANAMDMSDSQITIVLALGIVFAVIGAFSFGFIADKLGPKRSLYIVLSLWLVTMVLAVITQDKNIFFVVAALAGLSLGATRTCDRTFLITVAPPRMLGEAFGLFGLVGEFSSIIGPLIWGLVTFALESSGGFKYRAALLALIVLLLIGWFILRKAQDVRATEE